MLTLWSFARKHLRKGMKKMKSIPLEKITVLGGLAHRLLLNSVRLESDIYMPDAVCRLDSGGWPADAEGRTLLALVRQMEATGREPFISARDSAEGLRKFQRKRVSRENPSRRTVRRTAAFGS